MSSTVTLGFVLLGAALAALLAWLGLIGAAHSTVQRQHGYLHWMFYALVLLLGLGNWLSGRDLTTDYLLQELMGAAPPPLLPNCGHSPHRPRNPVPPL